MANSNLNMEGALKILDALNKKGTLSPITFPEEANSNLSGVVPPEFTPLLDTKALEKGGNTKFKKIAEKENSLDPETKALYEVLNIINARIDYNETNIDYLLNSEDHEGKKSFFIANYLNVPIMEIPEFIEKSGGIKKVIETFITHSKFDISTYETLKQVIHQQMDMDSESFIDHIYQMSERSYLTNLIFISQIQTEIQNNLKEHKKNRKKKNLRSLKNVSVFSNTTINVKNKNISVVDSNRSDDNFETINFKEIMGLLEPFISAYHNPFMEYTKISKVNPFSLYEVVFPIEQFMQKSNNLKSFVLKQMSEIKIDPLISDEMISISELMAKENTVYKIMLEICEKKNYTLTKVEAELAVIECRNIYANLCRIQIRLEKIKSRISNIINAKSSETAAIAAQNKPVAPAIERIPAPAHLSTHDDEITKKSSEKKKNRMRLKNTFVITTNTKEKSENKMMSQSEKLQIQTLYNDLTEGQQKTLKKIILRGLKQSTEDVTFDELTSLIQGSVVKNVGKTGGLKGEIIHGKTTGNHFRCRIPNTYLIWDVVERNNVIGFLDVPKATDGNFVTHGRSHKNDNLPNVSIQYCLRLFNRAGFTKERLEMSGIQFGSSNSKKSTVTAAASLNQENNAHVQRLNGIK